MNTPKIPVFILKRDIAKHGFPPEWIDTIQRLEAAEWAEFKNMLNARKIRQRHTKELEYRAEGREEFDLRQIIGIDKAVTRKKVMKEENRRPDTGTDRFLAGICAEWLYRPRTGEHYGFSD